MSEPWQASTRTLTPLFEINERKEQQVRPGGLWLFISITRIVWILNKLKVLLLKANLKLTLLRRNMTTHPDLTRYINVY